MTDRVALFREKVSAEPDNALFRFSLGQALWDEGEAEEALPHLELASKHRDDWMVPRILMGKIYLYLERPDEARPKLEEALALAKAQGHEDPETEARDLLASLGS